MESLTLEKRKLRIDFITRFTEVRGYYEVEMDKLLISRNIMMSGKMA